MNGRTGSKVPYNMVVNPDKNDRVRLSFGS